MAKSVIDGPQKAQGEKFAEEVGEILANKLFGESGPTLETSLDDIEEAIAPMMKAFLRGVVARAVNRQGDRLGEEQACPSCGQACPVERSEKPREMITAMGSFGFQEPRSFCPQCQRAFFPSAGSTED